MIPIFLSILGIHLGIGLLFGLFFAFFGAGRIDPSAKAGTVGFRLVIIPGCALFWPYLAMRWISGSAPPQECGRHRRKARPD